MKGLIATLIVLFASTMVGVIAWVRGGHEQAQISPPRDAGANPIRTRPRAIGPAGAVSGMVLRGQLDQVAQHLKDAAMDRVGNMVHALHVFGEGDDSSGYSSRRIVAALTDEAEAMRLFHGASPYIRSKRGGLWFKLYDSHYLSQEFAEAEHHPGQVLSILGEVGQTLDVPIRFADGTTAKLQDVLESLLAQFDLKGEIYWETSAFAYFLERPTWVNKFGKQFSFDAVASELLSRPPDDSPCLGMHKPLVLAQFVALSDGDGDGSSLVSPAARSQIERYLDGLVAGFVARQSPEGFWERDWHLAAPTSELALDSAQVRAISRLTVTGHFLELCALLPESHRPPGPVIAKARSWIEATLSARVADPTWLVDHYCPVSHALKGFKQGP